VGIVNYLIKQKNDRGNNKRNIPSTLYCRDNAKSPEMILSEGMGELIEELKK
jgi:hypothetical protein